MALKCDSCGGALISRGEVVCSKCGLVVGSEMDAEPVFFERNDGRKTETACYPPNRTTGELGSMVGRGYPRGAYSDRKNDTLNRIRWGERIDYQNRNRDGDFYKAVAAAQSHLGMPDHIREDVLYYYKRVRGKLPLVGYSCQDTVAGFYLFVCRLRKHPTTPENIYQGLYPHLYAGRGATDEERKAMEDAVKRVKSQLGSNGVKRAIKDLETGRDLRWAGKDVRGALEFMAKERAIRRVRRITKKICYKLARHLRTPLYTSPPNQLSGFSARNLPPVLIYKARGLLEGWLSDERVRVAIIGDSPLSWAAAAVTVAGEGAISIKEAGEVFRVSPSTVRQKIKRLKEISTCEGGQCEGKDNTISGTAAEAETVTQQGAGQESGIKKAAEGVFHALTIPLKMLRGGKMSQKVEDSASQKEVG